MNIKFVLPPETSNGLEPVMTVDNVIVFESKLGNQLNLVAVRYGGVCTAKLEDSGIVVLVSEAYLDPHPDEDLYEVVHSAVRRALIGYIDFDEAELKALVKKQWRTYRILKALSFGNRVMASAMISTVRWFTNKQGFQLRAIS